MPVILDASNHRGCEMDYQAVKLISGELMHIGDKHLACPASGEKWTLDRVFYDYEKTGLVVLDFTIESGGVLTKHYPLSSIEFLGGCSKTETF